METNLLVKIIKSKRRIIQNRNRQSFRVITFNPFAECKSLTESECESTLIG